MAYGFVGSGTFTNTVGGAASVNYSPTIGNLLPVAALTNANPSGLTLSDTHNTYNFIGSTSGGGIFLGLWWANVTTGGALTFTLSGAGTYGLWVPEYSGLGASPLIAGSFQTGSQGSPGVGTNILTTTTNPNVTTTPAMLFGISANINALTGPNGDAGPSVGTTLAYNSRAVGWLGSGSQQGALAEDFRITSSGANPITFGTVSGNQFDTFVTLAVAFSEFGAGVTPIAWIA